MVTLRSSQVASLCILIAFLVLLSPTGVGASRGQHVQHPFKRHEEATRPHIEFAAAPDDKPVLVKSQYNQFAPPEPPIHHGQQAKEGKDRRGGTGVSRSTLAHWMHKLGLHPSKHQIETLYGLVKGHKQHQVHPHQHNKDHGVEQEQKQEQERKPAWKEIKPAHSSVSEPHRMLKPLPVSAGILPPGLGRPHAWGDESNPSDTSKTSSPVAAAVAPLPEPANTIPAPTSTKGASWHKSNTSLLPPIPAAGAIPANRSSIAPVTSLPSTIPSSTSDAKDENRRGTSGSLNPSSTPPPSSPLPPPSSGGAKGDDRLTPLQNGTSTGKTVAGVPVADDGDMKTPPAPSALSNSTRTVGGTGAGVKSGSSTHNHPDPVGWTASAAVAGLLLVVLFFAI